MRVHPPAPNHGVMDPGLATYSSRIKGQPGAAALSAFQLYGLGTKVPLSHVDPVRSAHNQQDPDPQC
jgi:hypothetical protein